ncbi:hypothetical protein H4582DRAFT_2055111 [Lactarius indigo]|nr:hypothetical protein H4582DRAFT_2055111 [Lactarius indigo]
MALVAGAHLAALSTQESGALYLIVQFVFVILFAIQHPAHGIAGVIAVQICGIAPALIVIRVALRLSNRPPEGLALELRPGLNLLQLKCALGTAQRRSGIQTSASTPPGSLWFI